MTSHEVVEKSWDLSLYELHRTPQEAITDETEIAVSARSLQSELTCPICLDMLTSTMTTKECLHRFDELHFSGYRNQDVVIVNLCTYCWKIILFSAFKLLKFKLHIHLFTR